MKKEIADRWVAALRSGQYKQGTGRLRRKTRNSPLVNSDEFCCLGVLCDLHAEEVKVPWLEKNTHCQEIYRYLGTTYELPHDVKNWAELHSKEGMFSAGSSMKPNVGRPYGSSLQEMNDAGATFDQIALFIEANWRNL